MPRLCCGDGGWLCWGCAVAAGLGSPGWSRTRSCPSVSSQLAAAAKPSFHRLPKAAGVFCSPPPFNPDFHHSPGCACPPLRVRHRRVGGQELCRAQPRAQLFPAPGRPSPQMFSGCGVWLPVVGGSLASSGLTPGDVGDAHWSPRWELRWGGLVGQLVRCFLHVGASSCLISVFGNETNHQTVSVRGDKAASLPEPPAAGQGPSRGLPPGGPGP